MPKIRGVHPDFWTDEKVVELSPFARLLWIGLWNHACDNGHLQDKSKQIKMRVLPTDDINCADLLREIEDQHLIERGDGWITIPNLAHHQKPHKRWWKTCDKPGCVLPEGASHAPSNRSNTVAPPKATSSTTADGDGEGDVELMVIKEDADKSAPPARTDIENICQALAQQIEARGSKRPTITTRWRNEARLLLDRDGRTEEQVHACIRWLFTSSHRDAAFWRTNIRSMPKLRQEYDRLRELAERPGAAAAAGSSRSEEWKSMQERQMARAIEREREMGLRP